MVKLCRHCLLPNCILPLAFSTAILLVDVQKHLRGSITLKIVPSYRPAPVLCEVVPVGLPSTLSCCMTRFCFYWCSCCYNSAIPTCMWHCVDLHRIKINDEFVSFQVCGFRPYNPEHALCSGIIFTEFERSPRICSWHVTIFYAVDDVVKPC